MKKKRTLLSFCFQLTVYKPINACRPQYNETNVMHFSINLLRIKDLYMFRALLAHPQEALHKRNVVYCLRGMSVVARLQ
jgi:hypothetical protein